MAKCHFCGKEIKKGTGLLYVKKNGTTFYFCCSKCFRNCIKLGREGRKVKWTERFKQFKAQQSGKQ